MLSNVKESISTPPHKEHSLPSKKEMGSIYMSNFVRTVYQICNDDLSYAYDFVNIKETRKEVVSTVLDTCWSDVASFLTEEMKKYLVTVTYAICKNVLNIDCKEVNWKPIKEKMWEDANKKDAIYGTAFELSELDLDHKIPKKYVGDNLGVDNMQLLTKEDNRFKGEQCYNAWPFEW